MTTATSVLPRLLDAIQEGLSGVPALDGVIVLSGPADAQDLGKEYLALGLNDPAITLPQRPGAQDLRYRKEMLTVPGELRANGAGKGEANIRIARDRAFTLFAALEEWVRQNKTAGIPAVDALSIRAVQCTQGYDDAGRLCVIRFDLEANTSLIDSGV